MRTTLARYVLLRVVLPAAALNFIVNALFAMAAFPAGRAVPILGTVSAGGDTLVASFVVGFLTMMGTAPAARLEARAGRVPGLGIRSRALGWLAANFLASAVVLGVLNVLLVGLPTVRWLHAHWSDTGAIPRNVFVLFKAGYASVLGVFAGVACSVLGVSGERRRVSDPRWCEDPAASPGPVYGFDYVDKVSLAITNRERGTTGTLTWELGVRGALNPEHVKRALADVALRYPILTTKVQSLNGVPPFASKYRYAFDPSFRIDAIFDVVDARRPEVLAALGRDTRSRHLDLHTDFPLTLTMAVTGGDSCRLLFRQHQALTDGRAFIGLLTDFAGFLNDARSGRRPAPDALAPVARRGEVNAFGLSRAEQLGYTVAGIGSVLGSRVRTFLSPVAPLLQNQSNDYGGEDGTVHWGVSDGVLASWSAARERFGVSLHTLLTGAFFLANQRLHRTRGLPLGRTIAQLPLETRPRDRAFRSFANHLAFLYAEADLAATLEPGALLRAIEGQVVRQHGRRRPIKVLLAERWVVGFVPLAVLQKLIFETKHPAHSLSFSNHIPLEFGDLGGDGWSVDEVLLTTSVPPRHGIVLTALRYRGKLVFNFNYKSSAATRDFTQELCTEFEKVLAEIAPGPSVTA